MKVIILPNPYRDKQFHYAAKAREILQENGAETAVCLPFGLDQPQEPVVGLEFSDLSAEIKHCDVLLCLGGDGTILHAAKLAAEHNVPILGVNIGSLGFMTELEATEMHQLRLLAKGEYTAEERMMLDVSVLSDGKTVFHDIALNDAVITKGAVARVVQMEVACDGKDFLNFCGDGVILATPTGSTAYSMSAGGPILEPTLQSILITPICAHGQNCNCFAADSNRRINISVEKSGRRNAFLSVDGGRAFRLESRDTVTIRKSDQSVRLIHFKHHSFYDTMNRKIFNKR